MILSLCHGHERLCRHLIANKINTLSLCHGHERLCHHIAKLTESNLKVSHKISDQRLSDIHSVSKHFHFNKSPPHYFVKYYWQLNDMFGVVWSLTLLHMPVKEFRKSVNIRKISPEMCIITNHPCISHSHRKL